LQVGQKRGFTIANPGGRAAECNVVVIAPNGSKLPTTVTATGKESFYAEFTPTMKVEAEDKDSVRVDIRDPRGRPLPVQIEQLPDKHVRASCRFREIGTHTIETFISERPIGDKVQQRVVDAVNAVQLVSELKKEVVSERAEHKILIVSGLEEEVDVTVR
ncbi:hypothetical protein COOONC_05997, partial [Cooperia oncophora]